MNIFTQQFACRVAAVMLGLVIMLSAPAEAASRKTPRPMDLDCAARTVAERTGGKILAADVVETKNGHFFRIKVLTPNGHVRYVRIGPNAKCVF